MKAWHAPRIHTPIHSRVLVPGSKSQTARALYLAATGEGRCEIEGILRSRDTDLFTHALEVLGAGVTMTTPTRAVITPIYHDASAQNERVIDCGLAGTVMRFLPPLAALSSAPTRFDGDQQAYARPLAPLLSVLENLGAQITYHGEEGHLPFTICGPLQPMSSPITVDASASSQFFSAMLLIAPLIGGAVIRSDQPLISLPHIEMTLEMMRETGLSWERLEAGEWKVEAGRSTASSIAIEADLSNAGPFLCAGILSGGEVTIPNWPCVSTQPGAHWPELFAQMGIETSFLEIEAGRGELTVHADGPGSFSGIEADMSSMGEMVPTLAALLLFASSPSTLTGIAHLRGHETDRLNAIAASITDLGGCVEEFNDGLRIIPGPLHGATLHSFADHRMATFAAIVGLMIDGVSVDDISCTSKTLPGFEQMWAHMCEERGNNVQA